MEILGCTKLTDYKWINLFDVEYKNMKGDTAHWLFASRKANPVQGNFPLQADAVVIVPIHKNGKKRSLVAIKEFRIPLGDYEYASPAGLYDQNESAEEVARRELKEETGLDLTKVLYVSQAAVSSAGLSDESVCYVVCECTGEINNAGHEGSEEITVELLDIESIKRTRNSNVKISAKTLPFWLMFEGLKKIKWPKSLVQKQPKQPKAKKSEVKLLLEQIAKKGGSFGTFESIAKEVKLERPIEEDSPGLEEAPKAIPEQDETARSDS